MSVYAVRDKNGTIPENIARYIKTKIEGKTSVTANDLLEMLKEMYNRRILIDVDAQGSFSWNLNKLCDMKLIQGAAFNGLHALVNSLINVIAELGVTTFDFSGISDMHTRCFITTEKRPKTITVKGVFTIRDAFVSETHACCGKTIIDGTLIICQPRWRSRDIEIPKNMKIKHILLLKEGEVSQEYDTEEAYRNRPERLNRLNKMREARQEAVAANETGLLTFKDCYLVPLEVGCIVAHSFGGRPARLCIVEGQTTTHIKVRQLQCNKVQKIEPYNLIRIR